MSCQNFCRVGLKTHYPYNTHYPHNMPVLISLTRKAMESLVDVFLYSVTFLSFLTWELYFFILVSSRGK